MKRTFFLGVAAAGLIAAGSSAALADGDTLRIGHYDLPAQFGMPYGTFGANGALVLMAVYDAITYVDADGNTNPGLAVSWEVKDENTWVFKLRPGVKFHNGAPFNAATVVANIDAINNDEIVKNHQSTRQLRGIPSARALDDLTVEITTAKPDPILDRRLAIMRPHEPGAWADLGADYGTSPIGTGPYKISVWNNEEIIGTAFEEGWRVPRIKNLHVLELPENSSRLQALCSGQVDLANQLTPDDAATIEGCGRKVVTSATNNTVNLILRHMAEGSPVADVRVRQAMNYAYDKQTFVDTVLQGTTRTAGQPTTHRMSGFQADIEAYPYDPDKARALLAEAGYPNGVDLLAEIVVTTGEFKDTFQAMEADLKKVGINLELRVITIPDLVSKILGQKKWEGDGFSMMYEGFPSADLSRPMNTHSCIFFNKHTCFEEIMPTIHAMNSEFDTAKRAALQRKIAQFYHDQATAVYSHERVQLDGLASNLMNYTVVNRTIPYAELMFEN
jgi:peptide/nickel transport system substrate-binding protein